MITETVERWDPSDHREAELQVGRDLQYIRINGTVVGALAGPHDPRDRDGRAVARVSPSTARKGVSPTGVEGQTGACTSERAPRRPNST